jgi:hypothetical protein
VWVPAVALAASVALIVAVGLQRDPDVPRGEGDGIALVAPPEEIAAGAAVTFRWAAVAGASRYELEVLDSDGKVVSSRVTEATSVTLDGLAAGSYRWWVRATAGAEARSALRTLRAR